MDFEPTIFPPANLLESVLLRPQMYTMTGTFEECICFLNGYYSGMAHGEPMTPKVIEWGLFREWVAEQLQVGQTGEFAVLRERAGSSEDALKQLAILAGRFRAIK